MEEWWQYAYYYANQRKLTKFGTVARNSIQPVMADKDYQVLIDSSTLVVVSNPSKGSTGLFIFWKES